MKYFITHKNNIITGFYYDNEYPNNVDYKPVSSDFIDSTEISIGENIENYSSMWRFILPVNKNINAVPVKFFNNTHNYSISFVETDSNIENLPENLLSIGLICCDKDYQVCQKTVELIKSWNYNYEIIVVDNCEENNISFGEDVKHIKTNKNMFPFAGRQKIAEAAHGKYLWFIDGDDKVTEPNLYWLFYENSDAIVYHKHTNFYSSKQVEDLVDYCAVNHIVDGTLHNIFFKKEIYKQALKEWGDKIIWYYEDTFYLYYFLSKCTKLFVINQEIYKYDRKDGGLVFKIQNIDDLKKLCINAEEMVKLLQSKVLCKYNRLVENQYYFGMEYFLGIHNLIKYKDYINSIFPYTTSYIRTNELFDKVYTKPIKEPSKKLTIIYIYYGTNLSEELDYVASKVHCNYNLIVIDYFNKAVLLNNNVKVIKHTTLKQDFMQALQFTSENIWILESYKKINYINDNLIFNKTTVYSYKNNLVKDLDFECERNNIIFSKSDFAWLCKNVVNLQSLERTVSDFIKTLDDYPIWAILVIPDKLDAKRIYNKSGFQLSLEDNIKVVNKNLLLEFLSANLCYKDTGFTWFIEDGLTFFKKSILNGVVDIKEINKLRPLIKPHKKVGILNIAGLDFDKASKVIDLYKKKFKYIIVLTDKNFVFGDYKKLKVFTIPFYIDYYNTLLEIKKILPKNRIIELEESYSDTVFTVLPKLEITNIIQTCLMSWNNLKGDIDKKIYCVDDFNEQYFKGIDTKRKTRSDLESILAYNIERNNKNYKYIPYNTYFSDVEPYNDNIDKALINILDLDKNKYYVINVLLWNKYKDDIVNNFDNYIVYNNLDIECIDPPSLYIHIDSEDFIYFSELQSYFYYALGNKIELVNIQNKDFLYKIIGENNG